MDKPFAHDYLVQLYITDLGKHRPYFGEVVCVHINPCQIFHKVN